MKLLSILTILITFATAKTFAAANEKSQALRQTIITVPFMEKSPVLDGTISQEEYRSCAEAMPMIKMRNGTATDDPAKWMVGYTDRGFYLAFRFNRPLNAVKPQAKYSRKDKNRLWKDDIIETLIKPNKSAYEYDFIINAKGHHEEGRRQSKITDTAWVCKWQAAARTTETGWEGEMFVPYESMAAQRPSPGSHWRIIVSRNRKTPFREMALSSYMRRWKGSPNTVNLWFAAPGAPYVSVEKAGTLNQDTAGAILKVGGKSGNVKVETELIKPNPNVAMSKTAHTMDTENQLFVPKKVKLNFFDILDGAGADKLSRSYTAVARKDEKVSAGTTLKFSGKVAPGEYILLYTATGNGRIIAAGALPFEQKPLLIVKPEASFLCTKKLLIPVEYPKVRNISASDVLSAELTDKNGMVLSKASQPVNLAKRTGRLELSLADKSPGKYKIKVSLGKNLRETIDFTIPGKPEWFGCTAGTKNIVPPPWTPVKVSGNNAKVVLRKYQFANSGLPLQIISKDEKLLTAPVTLTVDGKEPVWIPGKTKLSDTSYVRTGSAEANGVKLFLRTQLEYDGMIRYDLTFAPAGKSAKLSNMVLNIPYRKNLARNKKKFVSKDFTYHHLLGNYEIGLFWGCEWAKNWRIGKLPAMEITPKNNTLDWKIRYIGREGMIVDKPRTITFALQALPVKKLSLKQQKQNRRAYGGTAFVNKQTGQCTLAYNTKNTINPEEGFISFIAAPKQSKYNRLMTIGSGKDALHFAIIQTWAVQYANTPVLHTGNREIKNPKQALMCIKGLYYVAPWEPFAISWKRAGNKVNLTIMAADPRDKIPSAQASIPWTQWRKALSKNQIVFGGCKKIYLDNVVAGSRQLDKASIMALATTAFARDRIPGYLTLCDPLDELRFSRAQKRTVPLKGPQGISGDGITGSFVKTVDGCVGKGVKIPSGDTVTSADVLHNLNVNTIFDKHEQWKGRLGYGWYGLNFAAAPDVSSHMEKLRKEGFGGMFYGGMAVPVIDKNIKPFLKELVLSPKKTCYESEMTCFQSPLKDYIVYGWKKNIDINHVTGIHGDNMLICYECKNTLHGCGWYDENNKLRGRFPFLATREAGKRIYQLFHVYIKDGIISLHAGARNLPPVAAFSDVIQFGEGGSFTHGTWKKLELPEDSSNINNFLFGVNGEFLTKGRQHRFGPNWLYIYAMISGQSLRFFGKYTNPKYWHVTTTPQGKFAGNWKKGKYAPYFVKAGVSDLSVPIVPWFMLQDEFDTVSAGFAPFWQAGKFVKFNAPLSRGAVYSHYGKDALIIVCNFANKPVDEKITVDLGKLGLAGHKLSAYDAWLDTIYQLNGNVVSLKIPASEYRIIRLENDCYAPKQNFSNN